MSSWCYEVSPGSQGCVVPMKGLYSPTSAGIIALIVAIAWLLWVVSVIWLKMEKKKIEMNQPNLVFVKNPVFIWTIIILFTLCSFITICILYYGHLSNIGYNKLPDKIRSHNYQLQRKLNERLNPDYSLSNKHWSHDYGYELYYPGYFYTYNDKVYYNDKGYINEFLTSSLGAHDWFSVEVVDNSPVIGSSLSLKDYMHKLISNEKNVQVYQLENSKEDLSALVVRYPRSEKSSEEKEVAYIENPNQDYALIITISRDIESEHHSDSRSIYSIINSIKFTKVEESASTNEDRQTYQNKEYGFEFEYPGEFFIEVSPDQQRININALSPEDPLRQSSVGLMSNMSILVEKDKNLLEIIKDIEDSANESITKEEVLLDNLEAIQITYKGVYGGETHFITLVENNSYIYKVYYTDSDQCQSTFNQILSTFKFIDN